MAVGSMMLLCVSSTALRDMAHLNSGTVKSTDRFGMKRLGSIYNEDYSYEGVFSNNGKWNTGGLNYLYKNTSGTLSVPASGMRSSVPLGGFGSGGIELRADGRIGDWGTTFNNGPQAKTGAGKVENNNFAMGVAVGDAYTMLRTQPPAGVPAADAVASMTYSGAFPVSRIVAEDARLGAQVVLNAFSHFEMHNPEESSLPAIHFTFTVAGGASDADAAVLFNLPTELMGGAKVAQSTNGVTLNGVSNETVGNMTLAASSSGVSFSSSWGEFADIGATWSAFKSGKGELPGTSSGTGQAALSVKFHVPANTNTTVTVTFAYYFPTRHWGSTDIGQFYGSKWSSSEDVAQYAVANIDKTSAAAVAWQKFAMDNDMPDWLRDALVQTGGGLGKTSMYLKDGRWRQYESHSCAQMEPPHIHFYRALLYSNIFPTLEQGTVEMYAAAQGPDGDVQELFGCGCGGCAGGAYDLDTAKGGARSDDTSLFLIDAYMNLKWHGQDGEKVVTKIWPSIVRALSWATTNAATYGLPQDLRDTFDEHGVMGDTNSYSGIVYLTGLAAAHELAVFAQNTTMATEALTALATAKEKLMSDLWVGDHFRSFWCNNGNSDPIALQGDVLYGHVWAQLLGLVDRVGLDNANIVSHQKVERSWNLNDFGIQFATNRTYSYDCKGKTGGSQPNGGFQDHDTWTMMSIDHASVGIFQGQNTADALEVARRMIDSYRTLNNDQWDFRDLSSTYPDAVEGEPSRPVCNSHYTRQAIMWAIPIALSGQQWDSRSGRLTLAPKEGYARMPLMLGSSVGIVTVTEAQCVEIETLSTSPNKDTVISSIALHGVEMAVSEATLRIGDKVLACPRK